MSAQDDINNAANLMTSAAEALTSALANITAALSSAGAAAVDTSGLGPAEASLTTAVSQVQALAPEAPPASG